MTTAKCVFCGKEQEDYKGLYLIKNDGISNYYCSGKCRKNHLKLRRDKKKVRWTEAFHLQRGKRLESDKRKETKLEHKKKEKNEEVLCCMTPNKQHSFR